METQITTQKQNKTLGELMHSPAVIGKLNEVWNSPQMANSFMSSVVRTRRISFCIPEYRKERTRDSGDSVEQGGVQLRKAKRCHWIHTAQGLHLPMRAVRQPR